MNEHRCPICNKPTYVYFGKERKDGLCAEHGKMEHDGAIIQCTHCGKWHKTEEQCECQSKDSKYEEQKENKCLTCDNKSGKYLFCKECFAKYHGKTLLFKITCDNNQKLELLSESYEGIYTCKDGHIVKSKSERDIDNYLFEHEIAHAYEKKLVIGKETFKPDFYLKDKDIYIEHWGYGESNKEYTEQKNYKLKKYKEKGITLISTTEQDMQDVESSLELKLNNYKKGQIQ